MELISRQSRCCNWMTSSTPTSDNTSFESESNDIDDSDDSTSSTYQTKLDELWCFRRMNHQTKLVSYEWWTVTLTSATYFVIKGGGMSGWVGNSTSGTRRYQGHQNISHFTLFLSFLSPSDSSLKVEVYIVGSVLLYYQLATMERFYRATACNATHGIAVAILSVCPSVRQMRVLWQN